MEFHFWCPSCGQKLKADEEAAGKRVDCPHCGVVFQDGDPTGNAPVNGMRKALFGAQTPAQAERAKTVFEGAMYERLPRPFVTFSRHGDRL